MSSDKTSQLTRHTTTIEIKTSPTEFYDSSNSEDRVVVSKRDSPNNKKEGDHVLAVAVHGVAAAVLETALSYALALSSSATARSSAFALGSRRAQFMLERDRQRISKSVFTSENKNSSNQRTEKLCMFIKKQARNPNTNSEVNLTRSNHRINFPFFHGLG